MENKSAVPLPARVPPIALLGIFAKHAEIRTGPQPFWIRHIHGLRNTTPLYFFPQSLGGQKLLLGVYHPFDKSIIELELRPLDGGKPIPLKVNIEGRVPLESDGNVTRIAEDLVGWQFEIVKLPRIILFQPNRFKVVLILDSEELPLGYLNFVFAPPSPFTPSDIVGIRSDPFARKLCQVELVCEFCESKLRAYTALARDGQLESEGWVWQQALQDRFKCKCGRQDINLEYLKKGLHGVLRHTELAPDSGVHFMAPLYSQSALKERCRRLSQLLHTDPKEEELQVFLEDNPIFFFKFHPISKIMQKAPILGKYKTDFAILTERKELLLIEIERPEIAILKKDGGVSAELQHALDQVHNWRRVLEDHRSAALEGMGLKLENVGKVKGVVIAGRRPNDPERARKLASLEWLDVELFTYDDLISSVREITNQLANI